MSEPDVNKCNVCNIGTLQHVEFEEEDGVVLDVYGCNNCTNGWGEKRHRWSQFLSKEARESIAKFPEPCEAAFEILGSLFPVDLCIIIVSNTLDNSDLTFALEYMGKCTKPSLARLILVPFLKKKDPILREGALLGLSNHLTPDLISEIVAISVSDDSMAVRVVAKDLLENYGK